jgi:hypothetical protein
MWQLLALMFSRLLSVIVWLRSSFLLSMNIIFSLSAAPNVNSVAKAFFMLEISLYLFRLQEVQGKSERRKRKFVGRGFKSHPVHFLL